MMRSGSITSGSVLSGDSVVAQVSGQEDLLCDATLASALPYCMTMACPGFRTVCGEMGF
jgi:hypothetical protein